MVYIFVNLGWIYHECVTYLRGKRVKMAALGIIYVLLIFSACRGITDREIGEYNCKTHQGSLWISIYAMQYITMVLCSWTTDAAVIFLKLF